MSKLAMLYRMWRDVVDIGLNEIRTGLTMLKDDKKDGRQ
jgi:hypothetical protein